MELGKSRLLEELEREDLSVGVKKRIRDQKKVYSKERQILHQLPVIVSCCHCIRSEIRSRLESAFEDCKIQRHAIHLSADYRNIFSIDYSGGLYTRLSLQLKEVRPAYFVSSNDKQTVAIFGY